MIPPSLNQVAQQWREYLKEVPIKTVLDSTGHVPGACSVYSLRVHLITDRPTCWWYIGYTARDPKVRLSEHCSDLRTCHVTVNNTKAKLYDPKYMAGLRAICLNMSIKHAGLKTEQALTMERLLAHDLRLKVGEALLTNQAPIR